jgi:CubicO group peptidase (beta-lactamase class C family)
MRPILAYDRCVDERGRYLVYSVTKTFLGVLCLRLELDLEAPVATWIDDAACRAPPCGSC